MSDTCEVIGEERLRDLLCHMRDVFALNDTVVDIQAYINAVDSLLDSINGEKATTTLDKLSRVDGTKQAIKTAIKAKGQKVSDKDTFRSYADKILAISGGGDSPGVGGPSVTINTIMVCSNACAMKTYTPFTYPLIKED